jgi:hypothetical protein
MRIVTVLTAVLLLSLAGYGQQKNTPAKTTYKGKMKSIQFEYFSNWKLDDGAAALTLTPDGFKDNYVEIHKEKLTGTVEQFLDTMKAEGTTAEPITFNGMQAYKTLENEYSCQYFIFMSGGVYYTFGLRSDKAHKEEAQLIRQSFKIK